MADLHQEQIELRLKNELDEAERQLREATDEEIPETRLRYRQTLHRFTRLVVDGIEPTQPYER
jgi:hypothetical protein